MSCLRTGFTKCLTLVLFGVLVGCTKDTVTEPPGVTPVAPSGLRARFVTATEVRLDWRDESDNENGFEVFESVGNDTFFVRVATVGPNLTTTMLTGHSPETIYYFKVRAVNATGVSNFSGVFAIGGGYQAQVYGPLEASVRCVALSPDSSIVAIGYGDHKIRIYDTFDGSLLDSLSGHQNAVEWVSFSPDGYRLASSSDEGTRIWSREWLTISILPNWDRALYTPDGRYLAVSGASGAALLATGDYNESHVLQAAGRDLFVSADGRRLVTGSDPLRRYNLSDPLSDTIRAEVLSAVITERVLAISPNAEYAILRDGQAKNRLLYVRIADGNEIGTLSGHTLDVICAAVSPDEKTLASGAVEPTIWMWSLDARQPIRTLAGHQESVNWLAWSRGGAYLVSASVRSARLWGPFR